MPLNARLAIIKTDSGYGVGLDVGTGVLNVIDSGKLLVLPAPKDVDDLLQNGLADEVQNIREVAVNRPTGTVILSFDGGTFALLVACPEMIICIGFNYKKQAEESM